MQTKKGHLITGFCSPVVGIPEELFALYLPRIGVTAAGLWAVLSWLAATREEKSRDELAQICNISVEKLRSLLNRLAAVELIKLDGENIRVLRPLGRDEFLRKFADSAPAVGQQDTDDLPPTAASAEMDADMRAVLDVYHQRVGMIGPRQLDKLQFWVETKKMSAEVVFMAIDEMLRQAPNPRIEYLEGILRNWYNDGVRELKDLQDKHFKHKREENSGPGQSPQDGSGYEGVPNATAYYENSDLIKKWSELYGSNG